MASVELARFIRERRPCWHRLEELLIKVDEQGLAGLDLGEAREMVRLYKAASADLLRARSRGGSADLVDYLNDLVARAHSRVSVGKRARWLDVRSFFTSEFPRLVRAERLAIGLAALIYIAGALFGAAAMAFDPDAWGYLLDDQHRYLDPGRRIAMEEEREALDAGGEAFFSAYLFTHNIRVTILFFAVGLVGGVLTGVFVFYNGVLLGALAESYHATGNGLFFWAWILPHGVIELVALFIAGGAGFVLGRALLKPGRRSRREALRVEGKRGGLLVLGIMPILVVAGFIEGTISQWHEPLVPAALKLAFAAVAFGLLALYLLRGGVGESGGDSS